MAWTALALAGLSAMLLAPASNVSAASGTGIQRCVGSDGTPIYTDRPCVTLGAERTPIAAETLRRIASDRAATRPAVDDEFSGTARPASPVARRSAASGCARTPTQLTMDLQGAWAIGDVNRIAESYHWVGMSNKQGQQVLQRLDQLSKQPLIEAEYYDAWIGSGPMQVADAGNAASGAAGIMQVTLGEGASLQMQDFDIERYRGCYFIRF